ncbi:uncharacterized protein LOC125776162 [Bactrocera dorsalis]|uniref:Uncharacterized protein LOC125776162 n=1 Tax=Bactrocera dorsalis TaxID=27457 RepID=A0ABM3J196_BACDO|nr:uncharacterized protein LOC125776162 [Bactrocera dorsalis]
MAKISDLKVEQLKRLLRERQLATTGTRDQLLQRLSAYEESDEVDIQEINVTEESSEISTVAQLQQEMKQLREMMVQLLQAQNNGTGTASMQEVQNANSNDSAVVVNGGAGVQSHATDAISTNDDSTVATNKNVTTRIQSNGDISANGNISTNGNMRHASVKEIANTLPEFDPTNNASITVEQFIDRVDRVVEAYRWDEKFLLLAIYTRLRGVARMWLDASPTLHTTWGNFADALRHEFGSDRDEAEIHFVKEYCFRVAALGIRYKLSEAAIIRYARAGLKHRELQQSITAMKFTTMKQMRDAIEDYFINRGVSHKYINQASETTITKNMLSQRNKMMNLKHN